MVKNVGKGQGLRGRKLQCLGIRGGMSFGKGFLDKFHPQQKGLPCI